MQVGTAFISLSLAGLITLAPPASAAPWSGSVTASNGFSYAGGGCTASSPGGGPSVPLTSNTPVALNQSGSATGAGPTAPDTGAMSSSVSGSAQINEVAGSLTGFDVTANLKASASRTLGSGSACTAASSATVSLTGNFSTASPGLLDLDLSNFGSGSATQSLTLFRTAPAPVGGEAATMFNAKGRTHQLFAVEAGDWVVAMSLAATANSTNTSGQPGPSADVRLRIHGDFKPFGVADTATTGSGAKYVVLPAAQTCASHSVVADFTDKAGKKAKKHKKHKKPVIKKATFFVNGAVATSAKKPNKKTTVTVAGLPAEDVVTVSAVLKLTGKGTVTVERSYLPCA